MRHCPRAVLKNGVIEQEIGHVRTRIFHNSNSKCLPSNNWKRDHVTNVKTYADMVKSKNSCVYSKTMLHNVTNVERQYKPLVDTKRGKNNQCINNMYQGVNVALDHGAKTCHIGEFPHILPNQNNVRIVKKGIQRVSFENSREKAGTTWSKAGKSHSTSSPVQVKAKGNISCDDSNDFVSKNKFSVLADLDTDVNTSQKQDNCITAGENVDNTKVSTKHKSTIPYVSEGVVSRVVTAFPLTEDKYDLQATFRPRHRSVISSAGAVKTFQAWNSQTTDKYGFIPLGDLMLPQSNDKNKNDASILSIHDKVCRSGHFNFMQAQIQIKSQLNPDVWDKYLTNYWDKQLGLLIRYGFPLDFDYQTPLKSNESNHKSAVDFQDHVELYLQEEMDHGAILGPFRHPPIKQLHISPFMTREKADSDKRRVIIDLSFPFGHSVNDGVTSEVYLGTPFLLTLPTIDDITSKIIKLGKGSLLYKIDVSRAFCHVKIDPRDYSLLGLKLQEYFIDTCLPFGFRQGSAIFQRLSDAVRHFMGQKGFQVTNYIDDVIGHATVSQAGPSFQFLNALLTELGFALCNKKMVPPTTKCTCLGIDINTETFEASIPKEKLEKILKICFQWKDRVSCKKRELQSLLGSLLYVSKCVHSSRPFLNRMLDLLRASNKQESINLNVEFKRDLNWFCEFLPDFNGSAFFKHDHIDGEIELDACLEGLGAIYNNHIYAIPIPKGYMHMGIVHLEMLNILVALRVWAKQWATKTISVKCDNQAVVTILQSGKTRDPLLAAICRNISMETAKADIRLRTIHIPGKVNIIADSLSRFHISSIHRDKVHELLTGAHWVHPTPADLLVNWQI